MFQSPFCLSVVTSLLLSFPAQAASVTYWSLFNAEEETALSAQFVTYASQQDMLTDQNRTGLYTPNPLGFGPNIVDAGSDGEIYWTLFNVEGETTLSAQYVTYASMEDMLTDQNRTGLYTPNPLGFGPNIVGSGSDGDTYWSLFNVEEETALSAQFVTYASRQDMLTDQNRTGLYTPNPLGFGPNIVDAGSDGETYWTLFNAEGETTLSAQYVTYASLEDMLADQNRTGLYTPNPLGFGPNIVGSGTSISRNDPPPAPVPLPASGLLLLSSLFALAAGRRTTSRALSPS